MADYLIAASILACAGVVLLIRRDVRGYMSGGRQPRRRKASPFYVPREWR